MKFVTYILSWSLYIYIYTCNKQIGKHIPVPWILQVPQNVDIHLFFFLAVFWKSKPSASDSKTSDRDVVGMAGISSQRWGQFSSLQKVEMIPGNPRSTYVGIPGTLLVWDPGVKGCKTMVSPYYLTIQHDDVICWIDIYDHDTCCFAVFFNDAASTNRQKISKKQT